MTSNNPVLYMIFHIALIAFPFSIPLVHVVTGSMARVAEAISDRRGQAVATRPSSAGVASSSLLGSTRTV